MDTPAPMLSSLTDLKPPYLSLIIPAFNEADRIAASLTKALAYLNDQPFNAEILVVNDGSTDATSDVVRSFFGRRGVTLWLLEQPANMGKGAAVRRGMLEARGELRVFTDADLSTPIYELKPMLHYLTSGTDVCIGSRGVDETLVKKHQPWYREFLGKSINKVIQAQFTRGIRDTQCGFKGFTASAAQQIFSRTKLDGFIFDVEVLYVARKLGLEIEEIAVEWYNDARSTVTLSHARNIIGEMMTIKKLHP
jgi:dolichyl-phosphate beta-glucosyltransferase